MFQQNPKEAEALSKRHFCIVGCGSVGGAITDMLVRAGVQKFTLVDPEKFKIENLARHVLTRQALDKYKCEALKDHILSINPDCDVNTITAPFQPDVACNFVVSAVDSYQCERDINAFAIEKKITTMYVGYWGAASVGEIFMQIPRRPMWPCYGCYAAFRKKTEIPLGQKKYTDLGIDDTRVPSQAGLWGNILFISAAACQEIFALLIRNRLFASLRIVNVSNGELPFRRLSAICFRVKKGCGVCGPLKIVRTTKRVVIEE